MATIRELAKSTGYSITTISRVLNEDPEFSASAETRENIRKAAQELGYHYRARTAKRDELHHRVGIIPIGMEETERGELQDPYYLYIRNGIEKRLEEFGIINAGIIMMKSDTDYEKLSEVDSVIVIGKKKFNEDNRFWKQLQHVIFVDYMTDSSKYDCVISDFDAAMKTAFEHAVKQGCQTVGYIGSYDYINDFGNDTMIRRKDTRQRAFVRYSLEKEMDYKPYFYIGNKFTKGVGYELAARAIQSGHLPDAFIVGSDPMTLGVYRAFHEAGLQIGRDIRIISIDDIEDAAFMSPSLTSVHIYAYEMGEQAVDCLRQRMEGRTVPIRVTMPVRLNIRESC